MCKEKINRNGSFWKHLDLDDIYLADLDLSVDLDLSGDLSDLVAQIEPFRRIRVSSQIMFLGRPDMKSTKFLDLYPPLISKINPLNIRNNEAFFLPTLLSQYGCHIWTAPLQFRHFLLNMH